MAKQTPVGLHHHGMVQKCVNTPECQQLTIAVAGTSSAIKVNAPLPSENYEGYNTGDSVHITIQLHRNWQDSNRAYNEKFNPDGIVRVTCPSCDTTPSDVALSRSTRTAKCGNCGQGWRLPDSVKIPPPAMGNEFITAGVLLGHGVSEDAACPVMEYVNHSDHPAHLFKDGDQWCILSGENLQVGKAGFGKTVQDACINFRNAVNK